MQQRKKKHRGERRNIMEIMQLDVKLGENGLPNLVKLTSGNYYSCRARDWDIRYPTNKRIPMSKGYSTHGCALMMRIVSLLMK